MKGTTPGSEIVQVEGGHIIRSTCRKDRHSKVYTSKGPRDRRVRLAAHTAIQFYDVQDRLGYDRPSKALDWLINKAQSAIHNLSNPTSKNPPASSFVGAPPDSHFFSGADESVSRASFHGEDLGLSLEGYGWNNGGDMGGRVGFGVGNEFCLQRDLLHQQAVNPWNHTDGHNGKSSDMENPFEVGLIRFPTRIYGEEEPIDNHG